MQTYPYLRDLHFTNNPQLCRHARNPLLIGRLGTLAGLLVFVFAYLSGVAIYGIVPGVMMAWLPAGFLAWGVARLTWVILNVILSDRSG